MTESASAISLITPVEELPGIGPSRGSAFRGLGLRCVADLLLHLPLRYEHEHEESSIALAGEQLGSHHGSTANLAVSGTIAAVRIARGRKTRVEATLMDGTGTAKLVWFNMPWLGKRLHPDMNVRVWGQGRRYGDYLELINPQWERLEEESPPDKRGERLTPIYPASENLPSRRIEQAVSSILEPALALLEDHLPEDYRGEKALPTLSAAYRMVHAPDPEHGDRDISEGKRRLCFDELLMLQLAVMLKKHHRRGLAAPILKHSPAIDEHIRARFPFDLTADQNAAIAEITADLIRPLPMNRLLQGDVGSGKTVVALYAMLMAVASEGQAALMAPTEILAEQHFATLSDMLKGGRVKIDLLTGSLPAAERRAVLDRLNNPYSKGGTDILIGTHALLTESVTFRDLALIVIDEQHRFGVHQRATLRAKSADTRSIPHTLVMTATPIPRTLALTVFGDLDISTIKELPPGRSPITTERVLQHQAKKMYRELAGGDGDTGGGDRIFVLVPVIDESAAGLTDIQSHHEYLSRGPFRDHKVGMIHGRMKSPEREIIMDQFRSGEITVLVCTTVIEVGVDIPEATVMVIEHADRFGLAQLHQLRGRVGRGTSPGRCLVITPPDEEMTDDGQARIRAFLETTDGFKIAEHDLSIRGHGEFFGPRQSGLPPFRVADLTNPDHLELLSMARRDAEKWIQKTPTLAGERNALLKKRLLKQYGDALGLGDVG